MRRMSLIIVALTALASLGIGALVGNMAGGGAALSEVARSASPMVNPSPTAPSGISSVMATTETPAATPASRTATTARPVVTPFPASLPTSVPSQPLPSPPSGI